jgi:hypothetical protein
VFDDELAAINRQIRKWESNIEEGIEDIKESMLNSLHAMKENVERKMQKCEMEKELERRFEQHANFRQNQLRGKGNKSSDAFSQDAFRLEKEVTKSYEAKSMIKVKESFDNGADKMEQHQRDFMIILSTCRKKSY